MELNLAGINKLNLTSLQDPILDQPELDLTGIDKILSKSKSAKEQDRIVFQPENADWSLPRLSSIEDYFLNTFGKTLPISNIGQGNIHNKWNYDHRSSVDVGLNPSSKEGKNLIEYLKKNNIPFLAFTKAIKGMATGPHIHIGRPSHKINEDFEVESINKEDQELDLTGLEEVLSSSNIQSPGEDVALDITGVGNIQAPLDLTFALDPKKIDFQVDTEKRPVFLDWATKYNKPVVTGQNPNEAGPIIKATLTNLFNNKPSVNDLTDAWLDAWSPEYRALNDKFRKETGGLNIAEIASRKNYTFKQGKIEIQSRPTRGVKALFEAYKNGGLREFNATNMLINQQLFDAYNAQVASDEKVKQYEKDHPYLSAFEAGVQDTAGTIQHIGTNIKYLGEALATGNYYGWNSKEYLDLINKERQEQESIAELESTIYNPSTFSGKIIRGATHGATSLPIYVAAGRVPAALPVLAYVENLHRGNRQAALAALPMAILTGVGRGLGSFTDINPSGSSAPFRFPIKNPGKFTKEDLSLFQDTVLKGESVSISQLTPFERQLVHRGANALSLQFPTEDIGVSDIAANIIVGLGFPVGKSPERVNLGGRISPHIAPETISALQLNQARIDISLQKYIGKEIEQEIGLVPLTDPLAPQLEKGFIASGKAETIHLDLDTANLNLLELKRALEEHTYRNKGDDNKTVLQKQQAIKNAINILEKAIPESTKEFFKENEKVIREALKTNYEARIGKEEFLKRREESLKPNDVKLVELEIPKVNNLKQTSREIFGGKAGDHNQFTSQDKAAEILKDFFKITTQGTLKSSLLPYGDVLYKKSQDLAYLGAFYIEDFYRRGIVPTVDLVLNKVRGSLGDYGRYISDEQAQLIFERGMKSFEVNSGMREYHPKDTPEFKEWFVNSKVVNQEGEPLILYHGTRRSFDTFEDPLKRGAFYFTTNPQEAGDIYGGYNAKAEGGNIRPVYLSLKNPATTEQMRQFMKDNTDLVGKSSKEIFKALKDVGYDGRIYGEESDYSRHYAVFDVNQIKSAISPELKSKEVGIRNILTTREAFNQHRDFLIKSLEETLPKEDSILSKEERDKYNKAILEANKEDLENMQLLIEEKKGTIFNSGLNPDAFVDQAKLLYRGIQDFAEFTKVLVERFGEQVKPFLQDLWMEVKGIAKAFHEDERGFLRLQFRRMKSDAEKKYRASHKKKFYYDNYSIHRGIMLAQSDPAAGIVYDVMRTGQRDRNAFGHYILQDLRSANKFAKKGTEQAVADNILIGNENQRLYTDAELAAGDASIGRPALNPDQIQAYRAAYKAEHRNLDKRLQQVLFGYRERADRLNNRLSSTIPGTPEHTNILSQLLDISDAMKKVTDHYQHLKDTGYISLKRKGPIAAFVQDPAFPKGDKRGEVYRQFNTIKDAGIWVAEQERLLKANPADSNIYDINIPQRLRAASARLTPAQFEDLIDSSGVNSRSPEIERLRDEIYSRFPSKGYELKRDYVRGYDRTWQFVLESIADQAEVYANSFYSRVAGEHGIKALEATGLQQDKPDLYRIMQKFIDHEIASPDKTKSSQAFSVVRKGVYLFHLGFDVNQLYLNAIAQPVTQTYSYFSRVSHNGKMLGPFEAEKYWIAAWGLASKTAKRAITGKGAVPTEFWNIRNRLVAEGLITAEFNEYLLKSEAEKAISARFKPKHIRHEIEHWAGIFMQAGEKTTRTHVAAEAYLVGKNKFGLSGEDLVNFIVRSIDATQTNPSRAESPLIIRGSQNQGEIRKLLYQFNTFNHMWLENLALNVKSDFQNRRLSATSRHLIPIAIMGGISGLPLAGLMGALYTLITNKDPKEEFHKYVNNQPLLERLALYGVTGNATLSQKLVPTFPFSENIKVEDTLSDTLKESASTSAIPAFSTAGQITKGFDDLIKGDYLRAAGGLLPIKLLRNAATILRYKKEGIKTRRGTVIVPKSKVTSSQLIQQGLGITPSAVTEYYNKTGSKIRTRRIKKLRKILL